MSQKIFITYSNERFELSKKQILKEAEELGIFDKCIGYSPKDLPDCVKANPLMAFIPRGGYWCWKPYVIWKTIQDYPDAVVVYVDAGSKLQKGKEWDEWFAMMDNYDTLLQHYRGDVDYGWGALYPGVTVSTTQNRWTKKSVLDYYDGCFNNQDWHEYPAIWAGFVITTGKSRVIKEWFEMSLFHPDFFYLPYGREVYEQDEMYIENRADQSVLTAIAYMGIEKGWNVKVVPEVSESTLVASVIAARRRIKPVPVQTRIINWIKNLLGEKLYRTLHPKK